MFGPDNEPIPEDEDQEQEKPEEPVHAIAPYGVLHAALAEAALHAAAVVPPTAPPP